MKTRPFCFTLAIETSVEAHLTDRQVAELIKANGFAIVSPVTIGNDTINMLIEAKPVPENVLHIVS